MKPLANVVFLTSSPSYTALSPDRGAEVAFAGRSNAGKSSVLNALTHRKDLARTSSSPGKTRNINLFGMDGKAMRRLVDLPGYGYTNVGLKERQRWGMELTRYITERQSLKGVVVIMDMRHPLTELDQHMLTLCRTSRKAVHVLLNKSDKLKQGQKVSTRKAVEQELAFLAPGATCGTFSAVQKEGRTELLALIHGWMVDGEGN